jgi:hypothetical protein
MLYLPLDKLLERSSSGVVRENETTVSAPRDSDGQGPDPRQRGER